MAKHSYYKEWLEPDNLIRLRGWARDGLTHEEIADRIGIKRNTFQVWLSKHEEIKKAVCIGKDTVDREVEETLFQKAINGDTTAMIFWLKNRKPNEWRNFIERNTELDNEEQKSRIEKILLENEKLRAEIEQIRGETSQAIDDGFIEALSDTALEDWNDEA